MSCTYSPKLRTIYITGEITPKMSQEFRYKFGLLLKRNKKPITVEIGSEGGDIDSGLAIVDTIRTSPVKVHTIGCDMVMSIATLILAAGHHRSAYPNCNLMVHQGQYKISGTYNEIMRGDFPMIKRAEKNSNRIFSTLTGRPVKFWTRFWRMSNQYLTASEAMKLGLIDEVLQWRSLESV